MTADQGKSALSFRQQLSTLSKGQLLDVIGSLLDDCGEDRRDEVFQSALKRATTAAENPAKCEPASKKQSERAKPKEAFEMSNFRQRYVALKVQYDGEKYCGFSSQESGDGIEDHLFAALLKLNLISDKKTCNYSRCGRTDRGVSALGQVVALNIRSAIPLSVPDDLVPSHPCDSVTVTVMEKKKKKNNKDNTGGEGPDDDELVPVEKQYREMDYCTMINRCLPPEIRVHSWCPVTPEFSARFSATHRTYRYFFLRKNLDIEAMRTACTYLLGSHDFRNICKLDIANVTNFVREIFFANIVCFEPNVGDPASAVWMLEIRGIAFLWHMVRCIMALLFLVGEGKEQPEIVKELLDIEKNPAKPSYSMADDLPLVLHECGFERLALNYTPRTLWDLTAHYQSLREKHILAAARAKNSLEEVLRSTVRSADLVLFAEETRSYHEKAAKRLADKTGNAKYQIAKNAEPSANKRKFDEMAKSESDSCEIAWNEALVKVEKATDLSPTTQQSTVHIPLMQRNREHSYEDRIKALSGLKKDRYERHITLSSAVSETTPAFFQNMRKQGSL